MIFRLRRSPNESVSDFAREIRSVALGRWQSRADIRDARTGGRLDAARSARSVSVQHVRDALGNLRLLEAAGACSVIARTAIEESANQPPWWWEALAPAHAHTRSAIFSTSAEGFSGIDEWSQFQDSTTHHDLIRERTRLGAEHRSWLLCGIAGEPGICRVAERACGVAEIDDERAVSGLERSSAIVREFIDVPQLGREPSVYDFLQSAANTLALFLPLAERAVSDVRRFALLPPPLLRGYGS